MAGPAAARALDPWPGAPRSLASVTAWASWAIVVLATLVPRPVGHAALLLVAPLATLLAVLIAVVAGAAVPLSITSPAIAACALSWAIALLPETAAAFANGAAYGAERRFPLRTPRPVLLGPLPLASMLVGAALVAGPLLLADGHLLAGALATAFGFPLAALLLRSLVALRRRFAILVPGGLVLHDPLTLVDPVLLPRARIERLGPAPSPPSPGALDLRLAAPGGALTVDLDEDLVFLRARPGAVGEPVRARRVIFTPRSAESLLLAARSQRLPIPAAYPAGMPEQATPRPVALALVAFAFVVVMAGNTLPTPLYVLYQARLGFSSLTLTAIFAAYVVGVLGSLLVGGRLSDEVGRRPVLLCGLAASTGSALIFVSSPNVASMLVARILSGVSAGAFAATATAALTDLSANRKRATLLATACNIGGLGIGAPLAGALSAGFPSAPLRAPFLVHLGLLAAALVTVLAAPETVRRRGRPRLALRRPAVPAQSRAVFVHAALAGFCGYAVLGLFAALVPSFLAQLLGTSSRITAGAVVFVLFAASTVAQLAAGSLIRATVGIMAGLGAVVVGLMAVVGSLLASSLELLVAGAVVAGAGQGVSFRAAMAALNEATPEDRRAEVATAFFVVAYAALSIPVIGVGLAADLAGLRPAGVGFGACIAALAGVAMVGLARKSGTDPRPPETRSS